jgi:hypothetical protein
VSADAAPPQFRPIAASVWVVSACLWGVLSIVLGGVRVLQEWSYYRFLRDVRDESHGWIAYTVPVDGLLLVTLLMVVWGLLSLAWLASAVALPGRTHRAWAWVIVIVAAGATVVLHYTSSHPPIVSSLEPRLLTPAFVASLAIVLGGVAALAIARRPLRGD